MIWNIEKIGLKITEYKSNLREVQKGKGMTGMSQWQEAACYQGGDMI